MTQAEKDALIKINNSLNALEVKGAPNLSIVLGCMKEIQRLLTGGENSGNVHAEPKS
jgi:hypothetical protein